MCSVPGLWEEPIHREAMQVSMIYLTRILPEDVGKSVLHRAPCKSCGGSRTVILSGFGVVQGIDVGKRVYRVDGVIQVENDEQLEKRRREEAQ